MEKKREAVKNLRNNTLRKINIAKAASYKPTGKTNQKSPEKDINEILSRPLYRDNLKKIVKL